MSVLDQVPVDDTVVAKNGNGEPSLAAASHPPAPSHDLQREVKERFGVLPNFFRLAPENPEITRNLWGFAKFGYLDNPLPSLFKERLFVYLSRFCEVRYCIARHVGFLVGLGRPSGDAHCPVQTVKEVVRLIRRPFARAEQLDRLLSLCSTCDAPLTELPDSDTEMEEAIFACAGHAFLTTLDAPRCLEVLRRMLDESRFQHLLVFLAFIRTAHYWTKAHAELTIEDDIQQLLATYEVLEDCVLNDPEAGACELGEQLRAELASVRTSVTQRDVLQSLRESDNRLREMIDALPVAIYTTDAQGRLTHFNRAAVEFSGRLPELGTDQWHISWKLYRSDGTPMSHDECPMAIALKEGREVRGVEAIAERPDGKRIWFTPHPTPLRDAEGKVVGGINMLLDITERKRAEQASARLGAIVTSSDDAIISKDLDGIITSWNESAELLFGYKADEVIGRPVAILIPPNRLNEEPHILGRLRRGERVDHFETVRMRKDGSLLDISLTISPVKDSSGRIVGASKIARDITDRKRAEKALRSKEVQLEAELADTKLLQGVSAEMIHHDNVKTLYEKIMDAAVAIMRSDFASLQMLYPERGSGGELRLLAFRGFNPQAAKFWEWVRADSESTCGVALRTGVRAIAPDVEKCHYMAGTQDLATYLQTGIHAVQTTPLFSRSGKMVGMISTHWLKPHEPSERDLRLFDILARQAADLIERSQAEAALHDAHAQLADRAVNLEKLVGERTAKLRETISELESFSYSITHDMRAPLRAMQSFAAMLAEECSQLSAQGHDYTRRIVASAGRMDQLITDVLNYSRVAHADLPLKTVDTARLLREILESYPSFQPPQAVISLEEKLPPVLGNEAALTQCISNLLGNAVKFVPAGTQPRVRIFFRQDDSHVHLSFQDNGIGIEADAQKRIFQLFQRQERKYEGTGLGLAIVKKGVERMGGSVTLTSEPGQGSTFCLHLRRADSRSHP